MRRPNALSVALAGMACGALLLPAVGQAKAAPPKTVIVNARPVPFTVTPVTALGDFYNLGRDTVGSIWCPAKSTPLSSGWSGPGAFIGGLDLNLDSDGGYWRPRARNATFAGRNRLVALCARGAITARLVEKPSQTTISCGRNIALGLPLVVGSPYVNEDSGAWPVSATRWRSAITDQEGSIAATSVNCVTRAAFTSVRVVKKTGAIAKGATRAKVVVTCPARHRAIGWGYQVTKVRDFTPPATSIYGSVSTVPFVSASHPVGANKWAVQFTSPYGAPTTANTAVTAYATCAVPK